MHVVGLWEEVSGGNPTQAQGEHVNSTQEGPSWLGFPINTCIGVSQHSCSHREWTGFAGQLNNVWLVFFNLLNRACSSHLGEVIFHVCLILDPALL